MIPLLFVLLAIAAVGAEVKTSKNPSPAKPTPNNGGADLPIADPVNPYGDPLVGASQSDLEAAASAIASQRGATPARFLAIIDTENGSRDGARVGWKNGDNETGGDGSRGGAHGPAQITLRTAQSQDNETPTSWATIDPSRGSASLQLNPSISLALAASYLAGCEAAALADGGPEDDIPARYNSGKPAADAPASTTDTYVPAYLAAYAARGGGLFS